MMSVPLRFNNFLNLDLYVLIEMTDEDCVDFEEEDVDTFVTVGDDPMGMELFDNGNEDEKQLMYGLVSAAGC